MNNIERYIQKAVKRELAAQGRVARRNDAARRHIDKCAYAIRHNDGIKEFVSRAIEKGKELVRQFSELPGGKKIAVLISRIVQVLSGVFAAKSALEFKAKAKEIDSMQSALKQAYNETANLTENWQMPQLQSEYSEASGALKANKKAAVCKAGLKVFIGLLGIVGGSIAKEVAVRS